MIRVAAIFILFFSAACILYCRRTIRMNTQIDQRSYTLGGLATFAEMVRVGVKTLALSAPVTPEEMDSLVEDAERIAPERGIALPRAGPDCHRPVPG